jgi:hypothetical protein
MRKPHQRRAVLAMMAGCLVVSAILSEMLAPGHLRYQAAARAVTVGSSTDQELKKSILRDTPFSALVPTLFGVREVMASLMWVRADDYFHKGEYRPIIQMVRQITAIDPHQIDVYATGAWHMAYNFMDKRLIPDGVSFLEEGCKNNDTVYDLFFELGYMHYDKTKDFPSAVKAYAEASTKGRTTGVKFPPSYVRHQLAHAKEKMGDIDACVEQWRENLAESNRLVKEGEEKEIGASGANTQAARHNLYITQRRRNERLAAVAEREKNQAEATRLWQGNVDLAKEWLQEFPGHQDVTKDLQVAENNVERVKSGHLNPQNPSDLRLKVTVTRIAPKKIEVTGSIDVLNLSRVDMVFRDKDFGQRIQQGFDFKMNECTLEFDRAPVNKGQFKHVFDLDRDPADMDRQPSEVYPLKADQYELVVAFNPRLQAAFIQDRYGWNGEGLTGSKDQLVVDPTMSGTLNGKKYPLRTIRQLITLSRDDVIGKGQKVLFSN